MSEFDWDKKEFDGDIAFRSVRGIAVYMNSNGDVVIRQQAGPLDDEDTIITLPLEHVEKLIQAINQASDF